MILNGELMRFETISLSPLDYQKGIKEMVSKLRPAWNLNLLKYKEFNGGLTNKLVGAYMNKDEELLLFRIYGEGSDFIDRQTELSIMCLFHRKRIGSEVYAKFQNGICYEFVKGDIVNYELLQKEEIHSKVAQLVAKVHLIDYEIQSKKRKTFLFDKIREFIDRVPDNYNELASAQKYQDVLAKLPNKSALTKELDEIETYLTEYCMRNSFQLVLSHNDLLLANVIYNEELDKITFIDYEYASLNYQAYDIANHFNEYPGVENVDYNMYPTREYQLKWITNYLNAFYEADGKSFNEHSEEVEQLYVAVSKFSLSSHLFWGIWSLVQAKCFHDDFEFIPYALTRLNEYFRVKQERLAL